MSINTYTGISNPGYNNPAYYNPTSFGYSYQSPLFGLQQNGLQSNVCGYNYQSPLFGLQQNGLQSNTFGYNYQSPLFGLQSDVIAQLGGMLSLNGLFQPQFNGFSSPPKTELPKTEPPKTVTATTNTKKTTHGGYNSDMFNPKPLNPVWSNSDIPYNWAKSSPGLFGNIHGLNAILGRYVADTMPTPMQDPTAPGNTWIYAT